MGFAAANLIAMHLRVHFEYILFKTHRNKMKLCSVYVIFRDFFGKKTAQQQMPYINHIPKSLENNSMNGKKKQFPVVCKSSSEGSLLSLTCFN